ncbi:MAG: hypothetical protein WBV28_05355 [Terracidiphilus sp.]
MQMQRSDKREAQNPAVSIRGQEPERFKALIQEIWHRFTEQHIQMQQSRRGYSIDAETNP